MLKIISSSPTQGKRGFNIPEEVELKWSPDQKHFLRTKFRGKRQEVYEACIKLLCKHGASIICAVHNLNDCYGKKLYAWDMKQIILWATKSQLKFVAERFEKPYLSTSDDKGLMISDQYGDRKAESTSMEDISNALKSGTQFRQFARICMPPLMTHSEYCSPLQLADIVVGIIDMGETILGTSRWSPFQVENEPQLILMANKQSSGQNPFLMVGIY